MKKTVRLYACGGAGVTLASKLETRRNGAPCFADLEIAYLDTSESNMNNHMPAEAISIVEGARDGSGQIRKENWEEIFKSTPGIIRRHIPGDFNIVLHSGGGGSGSVIGPCIARQLLLDDHPTVVICIGSDMTDTYAKNTLATLQTYEGLSAGVKKPFVMAYNQNSINTAQSTVDHWAFNLIDLLLTLFSGEHIKPDTQDLRNFLRYDKVTSYSDTPVAALVVINGDGRLPEQFGNPISVATLAREVESQNFYTRTGYHTAGIFNANMPEKTLAAAPYHFVTVDGLLASVARDLEHTIEELKAASKRLTRHSMLSGAEKVNDIGFVF